jgi:ABC-2 type transport system permease protein
MMNQLASLAGVFAYEFRMQIRRSALWITMLLFTAFYVLSHIVNILYVNPTSPADVLRSTAIDRVLVWAGLINLLLPIAVGILIADRLPRDRRTKMEELLTSTPSALGTRIAGKYLGSTLATILPVLLFYFAGVVVIIYHTGDVGVIPLAVIACLATVLPGLLFVTAFSLACPAVLWVPLYQFLFIGYWFWGNNHLRGIPSLSYTILTPNGSYIRAGLFGLQGSVQATPLEGWASLLLILTLALLILIALWQFLRWQQTRM